MIFIAGCILIIVGFAMTFVLIRNSKRPRVEVKVDAIELDFIRQDKKKNGPQLPHAVVKYNYDGVNYSSTFQLKDKRVKEGDWIEATVNPKKPAELTMYAPAKEKRAIAVVFAIGIFLVGGSWWILDYFDAW